MAGPDSDSNPRIAIPNEAAAQDEGIAAAQGLRNAFEDLLAVDPNRKRIVVCDDDRANRIMNLRALASRDGLPADVEKLEFPDGKELIAYLRDKTNLDATAAIVCDNLMLTTHGPQVANFLRGDLDAQRVAFTLLSGNYIRGSAGAEIDELVKSQKIDTILGKPFEPFELQRAVAAAIQRRLVLRDLTAGGSGAFDVEGAILAAAARAKAVSSQPAQGADNPATADTRFVIRDRDPFGHRR